MGVVVTDNSDAFLRRLTDAVDKPGGGLDAATQFLSAKMRESMPGAGAARIDTPSGPRFIASSPGQPPGIRSVTSTGPRGGKRRSEFLRLKLVNARVGDLRWASGTNVSYAKHLEFGTATMAARPFMRPALRNNEAAIGRVFNARVRRIMEGGAA